MVTHDILELTEHQPSFIAAEARVGEVVRSTVEQWCEKVRRRGLPHTYRMRTTEPLRQPYE